MPRISPWPRRSALACSPPTPAWATSRTRGHASSSFDVAPCRSLLGGDQTLPNRELREADRLWVPVLAVGANRPRAHAVSSVESHATRSWGTSRTRDEGEAAVDVAQSCIIIKIIISEERGEAMPNKLTLRKLAVHGRHPAQGRTRPPPPQSGRRALSNRDADGRRADPLRPGV